MNLHSDAKIPVLVIFAPTACGKTALSVELFGHSSLFFKDRAEIVSADSMAVYRLCNVATAKPTPEEQAEVPHHLIDIKNPDEPYNAADFVSDADDACAAISSRGKLPVVMGGTGFYIRNFLFGNPVTPRADDKTREEVSRRMAEKGTQAAYEELASVDPESAKKIHPHDAYRIQRALEIFYAAGKPRSSFLLPSQFRSQYEFHVIIMTRPREELYQRINERVVRMFEMGKDGVPLIISEYKHLRALGYGVLFPRTPALQAIGYRELEKAERERYSQSSLADALTQIQADSRRYAKKQYTYIESIPGAHEIDADDIKSICKTIESI